jgi:hypothetical protein
VADFHPNNIQGQILDSGSPQGKEAPRLKNLDISAPTSIIYVHPIKKIRIPPEKCVKKQKPKKRPTN